MSDSSVPAARPSRKRFVILALLFMCVLINYMDRANVAVAGTVLPAELELSKVEMGLIFAAFGWTYSFLQVPGGIVVDLFRTRRLYGVIMFCWSCATLLQGFANSLIAMVGLRMTLGVFQAPSYPAQNKMVTRWFPDNERASAIAVYTSAQFLGLAVLSPILFYLLSVAGWRGVFIATGVVSLIGVGVMYSLYRDPRDHPTVDQAELDYIEAGGGQINDGAAPNAGDGESKPKFNWADLAEAFKHRKLWGIYIGQYCLGALFLFFLTWFPTYLREDRGLSIISTGFWGAVPYLGAFCGVLLSGFSSDWLLKRGWSMGNARKTPVLCGMLLASTVILANYTDSTPMVILFMTIAFFGNGLASIAWVFVSSLAPLRSIGLIGGVFNFMGNLSGATVPIIIGWLARDGDFEPALIFITVVSLIGFCSYFFLVGKIERIEAPQR